MDKTQDLMHQIEKARRSEEAADQFVAAYMPFIKAETAKFIHRAPQPGNDDELSVAMFAFYETLKRYDASKGAFFVLASRNIRNRLIDYARAEKRHKGMVSLDAQEENEDDLPLKDRLSDGKDDIRNRLDRGAVRQEILHFREVLRSFGLSLQDVADHCPHQKRTLSACHRILAFARQTPDIFRQLQETGKLPAARIMEGAAVDRKLLERHRSYIIAMLLAYTNGFDMIRDHLRQTDPAKGGASL